jgi:Response regulator containing a CheY-like receiver domain and an HTH DNA-binding domain
MTPDVLEATIVVRVLIVDDYPPYHVLIKEKLEGLSIFEVISAYSLAECEKAILEQGGFHLVILDRVLAPGTEQRVEKLAEDLTKRLHMKVALLTATEPDDQVRRRLEAKGIPIILKDAQWRDRIEALARDVAARMGAEVGVPLPATPRPALESLLVPQVMELFERFLHRTSRPNEPILLWGGKPLDLEQIKLEVSNGTDVGREIIDTFVQSLIDDIDRGGIPGDAAEE